MQPGGDPLVLCFVDFLSPAHAATAMDALQGELMLCFPCLHEFQYHVSLPIQFIHLLWCPFVVLLVEKLHILLEISLLSFPTTREVGLVDYSAHKSESCVPFLIYVYTCARVCACVHVRVEGMGEHSDLLLTSHLMIWHGVKTFFWGGGG